MNDLTNDQKFVLCAMYKHFLELQPGLSPEKANYFEDSNYIQENLVPHLSKDYVSDICWSLKRKEYIFCSPGDNLANNIFLEDKTLIYMEQSFNQNVSIIYNFLKSIKELLP